MITRGRASALLFGGAALGAIGLPAEAAPKPVPGLDKIDRIIVIYLENRSFDHLYGLFPGADGLAHAGGAAPQIDRNGKPYDVLPALNGKAYYDGRSLPMWQYAQEYVLADRFFQAAFGGTGMNHFFLFAGGLPRWPDAPDDVVAHLAPDGTLVKDGFVTPDGFIVNNLEAHVLERAPLQTMPHIGNRLDAAGVSWAWYAGSTTIASRPFRMFGDVTTGTPGAKQHIKRETDFLADLKSGVLPQVAFVKPADNEHPREMSGLLEGDQHAADLVKAVQESAYWKRSVIIVTYDEGHSFWDHVAPPKVDRWGPGRRVPAIVISPFAKKRFVDHTIYDTTSILKLIATRFGLEPLGARDAAASDMTAALDLR
jgi:phospholipase C